MQLAVDAAKSRNSVLDKLRTEQNAAAKVKGEWKVSHSQTDMIGSELHTVDSDLLHQGHNITWLERVTAQVLWSLTVFSGHLDLLYFDQSVITTIANTFVSKLCTKFITMSLSNLW